MIRSMYYKLRNTYRRARAFVGRPILVHQNNVVTIDDVDYCKNPIFILGCHRSGTSLFRRVINSHPNIAAPPETNFLTHFVDLLADDEAVAGLSGLMEPARVPHEVSKLAFRFHEAFRAASGKGRWADKTPQYVEYYSGLRKLAPASTQFLIIYRHPFDIAYSIFSRGWNFGSYSNDPLENAAFYVRDTLQRLIGISAEDNVFAIHYEDLVLQPEDTTRIICDFLGEPWSDCMLTPWNAHQNFGTEDPIARGQKQFKLSSGNWRALDRNEQQTLYEVLGQICVDLNYNIQQADGVS